MPHWSLSRPAGSAHLMMCLAVERYGLSQEVCLAHTGLSADELTNPTQEIAGRQELTVLRNILQALGPETPFGLEAGLRYRATTHGIWGLLLLTSPNLGEALHIGSQYTDLTYSFNRIGFEIDSEDVKFLYDSSDNPEDLRAALVERDLGALLTLERDILGEVLPIKQLSLCADRPPYAARIAEVFGVTPQWNAPRNCVTLTADLLNASSPLADALAMAACEQQCSTLLAERVARVGLRGRVRVRILRDPGAVPRMEVVASEFGMSTRTLRNQLRHEGTTYRELVEGCRRELAEQLLAATDLTVERIAERLGYGDASSFIAAFRRWTGMPPRAFRSA